MINEARGDLDDMAAARFSISAMASCVIWKKPAVLTPQTAAKSSSLYWVNGLAM